MINVSTLRNIPVSHDTFFKDRVYLQPVLEEFFFNPLRYVSIK